MLRAPLILPDAAPPPRVPVFRRQSAIWYPRVPRINKGNAFGRNVASLWLLSPRNGGLGSNLVTGQPGIIQYVNGSSGWYHGAYGIRLDSTTLSRFGCQSITVGNSGQLTHLMVYVNCEDIDASVDDALRGFGLAYGANPAIISSSMVAAGGVVTGTVNFDAYGVSQGTLDTTHPWPTKAGAVHAVIGGIYDGIDVKRCAANGKFIGEALHGGRWSYSGWSGHVFKNYNSLFAGANTMGVFSAFWFRAFSAAEMCDITGNPWQIFA